MILFRPTVSIHGLNAASLTGLKQIIHEACRNALVAQKEVYGFRDEFDYDIEVEIEESATAKSSPAAWGRNACLWMGTTIRGQRRAKCVRCDPWLCSYDDSRKHPNATTKRSLRLRLQLRGTARQRRGTDRAAEIRRTQRAGNGADGPKLRHRNERVEAGRAAAAGDWRAGRAISSLRSRTPGAEILRDGNRLRPRGLPPEGHRAAFWLRHPGKHNPTGDLSA